MEQSAHTPLTSLQLEGLHARIKTARVKTRNQAGKTLSYVEAYDIKATLIKIFGYAGFSAECLDAQIIREYQAPPAGERTSPQWQITAKAVVRLTIHQTGATYTEYAVATNKQSDWGDAADTALKSAESDALKRAASYLGTQFGLSLYKDGSTDNIINAVLAPDQAEITTTITVLRAETPEEKATAAKLQAVLKVHAPTVTEVATTASEPTVTEVPVATVAVPVAKALENAERRAKELDAAEQAEREAGFPEREDRFPVRTPREQKIAKLQGVLNTLDEIQSEDAERTADPEVDALAPRQRKTAAKRGRATKPTVTADKAAVARQALAQAERATGTIPTYYGPSEEDYAMDDAHQIAEDSAR